MNPPKDQAPGLVAQRLRDMATGGDGYFAQDDIKRLHASADRITQLEAENAELRGKVAVFLDELRPFVPVAATRCMNCNADLTVVRFVSCCANPTPNVPLPRAALTEQANIRSPVQNLVRDQYNPEDE